MNTYYELRYENGASDRLDGVTDVGAAKAVAKQLAKLAELSCTLVKVQEIDVDAPARTRNSATS